MHGIELILTAVIGSSGIWSFILAVYVNKSKKHTAADRALMGLLHDRICELAPEYITRGKISHDEYKNLHDYLYQPYHELGGNGLVEHYMAAIERLPIVD